MTSLKVTRSQIYHTIYQATGITPNQTTRQMLFALVPQQIRHNLHNADGRIKREFARPMAANIIKEFGINNPKPDQLPAELESQNLLVGRRKKPLLDDYQAAVKREADYLATKFELRKMQLDDRYNKIVTQMTDNLLGIKSEHRKVSKKWVKAILRVLQPSLHDLDLENVVIYKYYKKSAKIRRIIKDKGTAPSIYDHRKKELVPGEIRHFLASGKTLWHIRDRRASKGLAEADRAQVLKDLAIGLKGSFGSDYQTAYAETIDQLEAAHQENLYFKIDVSDEYAIIILANNHVHNSKRVKQGLPPLPLFKSKSHRKRSVLAFHRIASRIKSELRSADLLRTNEFALERAALIHDLHTMLDKITDLDELYAKVIENLPNQFMRGENPIKLRSRSIMLFDEENDVLRIIASKGIRRNMRQQGIKPKQGIAGYVFQFGKSLLVDDASLNQKVTDEKLGGKTRKGSYMSVPIKSGDRILGALNVRSDEPNSFNQHDLRHLEIIASILADKILITRLIERDAMLGLYNHTYGVKHLEKMLEQAEEKSIPVTFILFDIDYFKATNDTYGHEAGDIVLTELTKTARSCLATIKSGIVDLIGIRLGGEEIGFALQGINLKQGRAIAEDLRKAIQAQQIDIGEGKSEQKTISLGVASFPAQAQNVTDLLRYADTAMYVSKRNGRNMVSVFCVI